MAGAALGIDRQPSHTQSREMLAGRCQQRDAVEQAVGNQRHERIQFQVAQCGRLGQGNIVGDDAYGRLNDRLRNDRIDFSGHDRGAGLHGWQRQFP